MRLHPLAGMGVSGDRYEDMVQNSGEGHLGGFGVGIGGMMSAPLTPSSSELSADLGGRSGMGMGGAVMYGAGINSGMSAGGGGGTRMGMGMKRMYEEDLLEVEGPSVKRSRLEVNE